MRIADFVRDRRLGGAHPVYAAGLATFGAWLAIHSAVWGDPLTRTEQAFFERAAGQPYRPPTGGWSTVAILSPRRCGKSLFAATQAVYAAVRPGPRNTWAAVVAQGRDEAKRALFSTVKEFFEPGGTGLLSGMVVNETAETLELDSGCSIGVWPARSAAQRGISSRLTVLDEIDFVGTPGGEDQARALIAAARPTLATTGGKLLLISSPGRVGSAFHRIVCNWGRLDPHTLVLKLDTSVNPALDANEDYKAAMLSLDPLAHRAEVLGQYVEGEHALVDSLAISNCTVSGRADIPPAAVQDRKVVCAVDAASGSKGGDSFAACLGFRSDEGRVVVVATRRWPAPFSPRDVVGEISGLCRAYGTTRVFGDHFGAGLIADLFRAERIDFLSRVKRGGEDRAINTSTALQELAVAFASGVVEIPDATISTVAAELAEDIRSVVRKPGGRADAPRGPRGHADLACALAVLVAALPPKKRDVRGLVGRARPLLVRASPVVGVYGDAVEFGVA